MECIVLAGGMGTRLRSVVSDVPKCMAAVAGKPFLHYIVRSLESAGFTHIIFSLGYKHECVETWLQSYAGPAEISFVVESEPLGTGGGVLYALSLAREENVFVLNGDTFFRVPYAALLSAHTASGCDATLALKPMRDFDRYGAVAVEHGRIVRFGEKVHCDEGLINGGVYVVRRAALDGMPRKFSLEKDFFEPAASKGLIGGFETDGYFIDIGIPEDYARAQSDFGRGVMFPYDALVLDRDGVINVLRPGDYVKSVGEFEFIDGVPEALRILSGYFARTVVVTNQRGVGKGLMSDSDLDRIHRHMCSEIAAAGGAIDAIYCCTDVSDSSPRRKPNPGMALEIRRDFPWIAPARCLFVGDSDSDMLFAQRAGLPAVRVGDSATLRYIAQKFENGSAAPEGIA